MGGQSYILLLFLLLSIAVGAHAANPIVGGFGLTLGDVFTADQIAAADQDLSNPDKGRYAAGDADSLVGVTYVHVNSAFRIWRLGKLKDMLSHAQCRETLEDLRNRFERKTGQRSTSRDPHAPIVQPGDYWKITIGSRSISAECTRSYAGPAHDLYMIILEFEDTALKDRK